MNKLKKIIKKYKKLSENNEDMVLLIEEQGSYLNIVINGDNGVEFNQEVDKELKDKFVDLLGRSNIEFYETA